MSNVSMFRRVALPVLVVGAALVSFACIRAENAVAAGAPAVPDVPDVASPSSSGDADLQEISDYRLTIEAVRKWAKAAKGLKRLEEKYPELEDAGDVSDSASLDEMAAFLHGIPDARDVIENAGLDTREYLVVTFAFAQATMAQWVIGQGTPPEKVAAEMSINPANLAFIEKHKAELQAISKEIKE